MENTTFIKNFKVPACAESFVSVTVTPEEQKLLTAFPVGTVFSTEEAISVLACPETEVQEILRNAYCRSTLDKAGEGHWTCNDFYTRISAFCQFEPEKWLQVPQSDRDATGLWAIDEFIRRNGLDKDYNNRQDEVLPLDEALQFLKDHPDEIYLTICDCRPVFNACDHSRETCITFSHGENSSFDRGHSRHISVDEAVALVKKFDEEGLIHTAEGGRSLCNCCGDCCCYEYRAAKKLNLIGTWPFTNHIASHDADSCVSCGLCVERCRMHALECDDELVFHPELCVGCGLCTSACPMDALTLIDRK